MHLFIFVSSWKLPRHILLHALPLACIHKPSTINLLKQQWCNWRHQVSAPRFADVLIEGRLRLVCFRGLKLMHQAWNDWKSRVEEHNSSVARLGDGWPGWIAETCLLWRTKALLKVSINSAFRASTGSTVFLPGAVIYHSPFSHACVKFSCGGGD